MTENAANETKSMTQEEETNAPKKEAFNLRQRIGATTYEVSVFFSDTSRETFDEKILRMIRSEAKR